MIDDSHGDEAFDGKALDQSKKFDTPPCYAVQLFLLARKNFGGVRPTSGAGGWAAHEAGFGPGFIGKANR